MSTIRSKEIRLAKRPEGLPASADFDCAEQDMPEQAGEQALVRNLWMSVDPYMRGRMMDVRSYIPPFQVGQPLEGGAIGEIVQPGASDFKPGDKVLHMLGWREYAQCDAKALTPLAEMPGVPLQAYLGLLGMPGLTAYAGLLHVAALKEGETVFVSGAAGAVGAVVCQLAKRKNCTVIGSAGGKQKCDWLTKEAGIDAVIDYKAESSVFSALQAAAPQGIDVYFDNVGGEHLQAAIEAMRPMGRVACCGMIAQYNNTAREPGPDNLIMIIGKSLRLQGFIVSNHMDLMPQFLKDMGGWIAAGQMKWEETIYDGIQQAPQAFIDLFHGKNLGKMLVRLA